MRVFIIISCLLAFLGLCYYTTKHIAPEIEQGILQRTSEKLAKSGHSADGKLSLEASGRDITLEGVVSSQSTIDALKTDIQTVSGVRKLVSNVAVSNALTKIEMPTFSAILQGKQLSLQGYVSSQENRTNIVSSAQKIVSSALGSDILLTNDIELGQITQENWQETVLTGIGYAAEMDLEEDFEIIITGNEVQVKAATRTREQLEGVEKYIYYGLPNNYQPVLDIKLSDKAIRQESSACQDQFTKTLGKERILFGVGNAYVKSESLALLNNLAHLAKKCPDSKLTIAGHTDNSGNSASNKALSLRRAKAVARYLTEQGIDKKRLQTVGHGQERPIADNITREGRIKNRRIEIKVDGV